MEDIKWVLCKFERGLGCIIISSAPIGNFLLWGGFVLFLHDKITSELYLMGIITGLLAMIGNLWVYWVMITRPIGKN